MATVKLLSDDVGVAPNRLLLAAFDGDTHDLDFE
jgi:hypothetical protein